MRDRRKAARRARTEKAALQNRRKTAEHNAEGCRGSFRPVHNSADSLGDGPDALVCPLCGARRRVEAMGGG